ncbi:MAG: AAA family ATPase [Gammaproteobacteria bacterium]|nr:AAA family ATPase [Gammaproteobacteria bacterium]
MITYFEIKNFRSLEDVFVNWCDENSSAPPSNVSVIFGNNASGKTTLIRAVEFFRDIFSGYQGGCTPANLLFAHCDNASKQIELSCDVVLDGNTYQYSNILKVDDDILESVAESLDFTPFRARTSQTLFSYNGDDVGNLRLSSYLLRARVDGENKKRIDCFLEYVQSIQAISKRIEEHVVDVAKALMKDPELKQQLENMLGNFDLHIDKVTEKRNDFLSGQVHVEFHHHDLDRTLPIEHESHGTQGLYVLLFYVLTSLRDQSLLLIDEIESAIHPDIVELLIRLIQKKGLSKKKRYPQFIFTSHQVELMKCLGSKRAIFLAEKSLRGATDIKSAADFSGIGGVRDAYNKYKKGRLGASPYLSEELDKISLTLRQHMDSEVAD